MGIISGGERWQAQYEGTKPMEEEEEEEETDDG